MGAGDRVKQFGRTDQPRPLVDRAGIVDPDPSPGTVIGKVCGRLPLPLGGVGVGPTGWGYRWGSQLSWARTYICARTCGRAGISNASLHGDPTGRPVVVVRGVCGMGYGVEVKHKSASRA